jgi:cold shock CspA family protein
VDADVARDEIDGGIAEVAGVVVAPALGDEPEGAKVEKDETCVKGDDGGGGVGVSGASEGEGGEGEGGEKKRLFFHFSEVHDNIQLGLNDEVEFTVFRNPKNKEPNARHVVRTKAGTAEVAIAARPVPPRPDRLLALGAPLKHTPIKPGQPIRHQGVRQPLMPDGSRGFTYSREKSLRVRRPP